MGGIRPRLSHFIQKWVTTGPTSGMESELDDYRSQWPWDSNSGWQGSLNVNQISQLVAPTSSWWFKPETVILTNMGGLAATTIVRFYDGNGSRTLFDLLVSSSVTVVLDRYRMRGIFCVSGMFASIQSGLSVRVGGVLLASIANGPI